MARTWGTRSTSAFGKELKRLRHHRGWTLRTVGQKVQYNYSYLGRIEKGERRASRDLAERCDSALQAGGTLVAAWTTENRIARPAQLPATPTRLIGRTDQLALLDQALCGQGQGAPTIIAIDGPAGVGKTAVALRWAHDNSERFVDGQLYADLSGFDADGTSPADPATVLGWFCNALGAEDIPGSAAECAALYRSLLADRRVLVVLDNALDSRQVEDLLPAAAGCAAIVTSRRVLSGLSVRSDAQRLTIGPLSEPDAVALVAELIGPLLAQEEPSSVRELCGLCDHLPLALRIVAERVISLGQSVDAVVEEFSNDHTLILDHLENGDSPGVRSAISWSYRRLAPEPARMFRVLGLYGGSSIRVAAAAALAGVDVGAAQRTLRELARLHLVQVMSNGVIRLGGLPGAFARERTLTEDDAGQRAAVLGRIVEWSLATAAEALSPRPQRRSEARPSIRGTSRDHFGSALTPAEWCDSELRNFVGLAGTVLRYGQPDATWQCATTLWQCLMMRHRDGIWQAIAKIGDAARESASPVAGLADSDRPTAIPLQQGSAGTVHDHCGSRVAGTIETVALRGYAWTLVGAALIAIDCGSLQIGRDLGAQAVQRFAQLRDRGGEATSLLAVGAAIQRGAGRTEDFLAIITAASNIAAAAAVQEHGDRLSTGDVDAIDDQCAQAMATVARAVAVLHRSVGWAEGRTEGPTGERSSGRDADVTVRQA